MGLLLVLAGAPTSLAQDNPLLGGDGPMPGGGVEARAAGSPRIAARSGPRTSPFDPGEANDRRFIVDGASGLDTGCTFRNGGPLTFAVEVTRALGAAPQTLVANGLLAPRATLTMPAFDVDSRASVPGFAPERDRVLFNGTEIGFLDGLNNQWVPQTFEIPIGLVNFPTRGNGGAPEPAENTITVQIDVANTEEAWCTSLDWAALEIKTVSPVVMVHGNNSDGGFWDRQGFTQPFADLAWPYDNSISMPTSSIIDNGRRLRARIPQIAREFGVDGLHLVAHSKGGLDSREFLGRYARLFEDEFEVLSLTTLGTPHRGSSGADFLVTQEEVRYIEGAGFSGDLVARILSTDAGTYDLTTQSTAAFNRANLGRLPRTATYQTVGADADRNGNGEIDREPDEYAELRTENAKLRALDFVPRLRGIGRAAVNQSYQTIRNFRSVEVEPVTVFGLTIYKKGVAIPTDKPQPNDVLVSIRSATLGGLTGQPFRRLASLTGGQGRNHSSIADDGVASLVIPTLLDVERGRGDLR